MFKRIEESIYDNTFWIVFLSETIEYKNMNIKI